MCCSFLILFIFSSIIPPVSRFLTKPRPGSDVIHEMKLLFETESHGLNKLEYTHKKIQVNDAVFIDVTQGKYESRIALLRHFDNPQPRIGFNFCCTGATSFGLNGPYSTAHAGSAEHNNFFMPRCSVSQELVLTPQIELITCYIDAAAFMQLIDKHIERLPKRLQSLLLNQQNCYFANYPWQPMIKIILHQIVSNKMSPLAQKLFFESKVLELLAIVLDMYAQVPVKTIGISKTDIDKIHFARSILLQDIANPPGLFELAKLAGTNEFTLKKGFKELFHLPVYKYLHKERMQNAALLLQTAEMPVGEVAARIGYSSFSSFTQAFTKYHGVTPLQFKNAPF